MSKLVGLQSDKWLFPMYQALKEPGWGGKIRQVSIRITDLCNLRCVMCGQWGRAAFCGMRTWGN